MTCRALRQVVAALALLFVFLAATRSARADFEPSRAQADVEAAQKDKAFVFCSEPREPLSIRARALCPHAREIPGCEGLASACAKLDDPDALSWRKWLRWLSLGGLVARVLVWILVGAVALVVIVPIAVALARIWRARRAPQDRAFADRDAATPSGTRSVLSHDPSTGPEEDDLLGRAQTHAARGEYALALQLYLAASLRALDRRGTLRLARDRTNGEYVRMCTDDTAKRGLRDIVREVDRVQFGREEATPEAVALAATRAHAIVRALPGMLAGLALVTLLGCGGLGSAKAWVGRAGDDPAGDELFEEMLRRQGVPTKALDASLASLPLPKPGQPSPGVVVDVDRIALDEDTRAHLVAWVDAGGVLVLEGAPETWPPEFGAASATTCAEGDLQAAGPEASRTQRGALAGHAALRASSESERVAWFGDGATYAAVLPRGEGSVLEIASDELFTNVALSHPNNAEVAALILSNADCTELRIAHPEDGMSPPSSPVAALMRAGLGLGLAHALIAAFLLFVAVGVRMMRAKPAPPPPRRAFAEHVYAVGALYARTRSAPHALAAYARFADERLRARMPPGTHDVAAFLASRAHQPLAVCQRVWDRAMRTKIDQAPIGDELRLLKELSSIYAAATAQDK